MRYLPVVRDVARRLIDLPPDRPAADEYSRRYASRAVRWWHGRRWHRAAVTAHRERASIDRRWGELGRFQFELLLRQGLRPDHTFLDLGCGPLRAGVHLIPYLDPDRYCGVDANRHLLRRGLKYELPRAVRAEKRPRLLENRDFEVERFGERFDFALAHSLFTHLNASSIARAAWSVARVLKPGGVFLATFWEAPDPADPGPVRIGAGDEPGWAYVDREPYCYHRGFFDWAVQGTGLECRSVGEWEHPHRQSLVRFVKARNRSA